MLAVSADGNVVICKARKQKVSAFQPGTGALGSVFGRYKARELAVLIYVLFPSKGIAAFALGTPLTLLKRAGMRTSKSSQFVPSASPPGLHKANENLPRRRSFPISHMFFSHIPHVFSHIQCVFATVAINQEGIDSHQILVSSRSGSTQSRSDRA